MGGRGLEEEAIRISACVDCCSSEVYYPRQGD